MTAAAWQESYVGLLAEDVLARQSDPDTLERSAGFIQHQMIEEGAYYWVVVDDDADGEMVGVANAMPAREADAPALLELVMIYLRERVKGSGIADTLLQHTIGDADCCLWVLAGNERATAFYRRHGFVPTGATKNIEGFGAREVCLVRKQI